MTFFNKKNGFIGKGGRLMAATLTVLALAPASPALAGSFRVDTTNIKIAPDKATGEISLTNVDAEPVSVRVSALKWTQKDGIDVYEETSDVIASPPIFTVASGKRQLIRLGFRTRTPGAAYRLITEEVPPPASGRRGIMVALRLDMPLYVLAAGGSPALSWVAWRNQANQLVVEARNAGTAHSAVLGIVAEDASGNRIGSTRAAGVVLPASARRWTLLGKSNGIPTVLLVRDLRGEARSKIHVDRR